MGHVFRLSVPVISKRIYLASSICHTFSEDAHDSISTAHSVAEAQLSYRLVCSFYAMAEYRANQYRHSDVDNLKVRFRYKLL